MNNRFMLVVLSFALMTTSTGCSQMRNFLFGRGARCGLCNRLEQPAPAQPVAVVPAQPMCNAPTCVQPQPCPCQPAPVCSEPCGQHMMASPCDPYSGGTVIGSGTVIDQGYGSEWVPAPLDSQGYRANSPAYSDGYKVDKDGARILYEDPLPADAQAIN